jgi:hypothetical protein
VNLDKTTPDTKPFVIEYDDPDKSDKEIDPFDGEDSIRLLDEWDNNLEQVAMNVRRETLRQGIKDAGLLHLETDKTQPDNETEPTGRWRLIHKPKRANEQPMTISVYRTQRASGWVTSHWIGSEHFMTGSRNRHRIKK